MLNEVSDLSDHCKTMCQKLGGKEVPEELIRYSSEEETFLLKEELSKFLSILLLIMQFA